MVVLAVNMVAVAVAVAVEPLGLFHLQLVVLALLA
jgi:hypothetical protein